MTWDAEASGWDDDPAVRAYAGAAFACLDRLEREGRVHIQGARVLDFGCGTGVLIEALASRAAHIVALDTSVAMVDVLQAKVARRGWDHVRPLALPIEDAVQRHADAFTPPFDLIVCSSVLAFIESYPQTVKILVDHLAPAGTLVQWDWELDPGAEEPFGLARDQIRRALEGAGLLDVVVETAFEVPFEGEVMRPLMGLGTRPRGGEGS